MYKSSISAQFRSLVFSACFSDIYVIIFSDVQLVDVPVESLKRSALGRRVRGDPFAFGLGKRSEPFAFGLGRRKRFYWKYNPFNLLKEEGAKRDPYAFGLGK